MFMRNWLSLKASIQSPNTHFIIINGTGWYLTYVRARIQIMRYPTIIGNSISNYRGLIFARLFRAFYLYFQASFHVSYYSLLINHCSKISVIFHNKLIHIFLSFFIFYKSCYLPYRDQCLEFVADKYPYNRKHLFSYLNIFIFLSRLIS